MPSFSRATSRMGRFLAAWEISMSDLGLACCEGMVSSFWAGACIAWVPKNLRRTMGSGEARSGGELGSGSKLAGTDFRAVGRLYAHDADAPVGAHDGESVGIDRDDLAHLAGDPLGIARGQRPGVEDLQLLAIEVGPRAGRRIAAADEVVDLAPRLAPVDMGIVSAAAALIGRLLLVLLDARRLAGLHQVDRLEHRIDPHGEQPVEVDR